MQIGTGHVMRCLTLGGVLREAGAEVVFICRQLPGNLIERIRSQKFTVAELPVPKEAEPSGPPAHAAWAQVSWEHDASETRSTLSYIKPDWLIVDHYAFDERWEKSVRQKAAQLMVIDDLADRTHDCDLLLDQNLGRSEQDYQSLVPADCRLLIGPRFALLRPEFAARRAESLSRRPSAELKHILVSMGGIDQNNVTALVLEAFECLNVSEDCTITVVLGENAPWYEAVKALAAQSSCPTSVFCNVEDMAELMSVADLAIGGSGSTAWERCCLGLPTVVIVIADNQKSAAQALAHQGAALLADVDIVSVEAELTRVKDPVLLRHMAERASLLTDGLGAIRVCAEFGISH